MVTQTSDAKHTKLLQHTLLIMDTGNLYCINYIDTLSETSHYHQLVVREDSCEAIPLTSYHVTDDFPGVGS